MARRVGFARASEHINAHVGSDELLALFAEGDALVTMTAFDGLELAAVSAGGATFDQVVFKSCVFEDVDFSRCTFTEVKFMGCRFISCSMERCWLNRCDFISCSAPGLSFQKGRFTSVLLAESQMRYTEFSEASIRDLRARKTNLAESLWHDVSLKRSAFESCDLTRADVFRTPLLGIDLSTCDISGIIVSNTFRELRGCIVGPEQAVQLAGLLGIQVKEE